MNPAKTIFKHCVEVYSSQGTQYRFVKVEINVLDIFNKKNL